MSNSNIDKLFERVNTTWSDFYEVHTLSEDEPDVECIHLTDRAKQAIQQELLKARIETLEWLLEQEVEFGGLELKQSIIDKVADLQEELKENSDG